MVLYFIVSCFFISTHILTGISKKLCQIRNKYYQVTQGESNSPKMTCDTNGLTTDLQYLPILLDCFVLFKNYCTFIKRFE